MRVKNFRHEITPAQASYIEACARIRGISCNALVKRLFEVICRDDMVLSILDDDSACKRRPNERSFRDGR